MRSLACGSRWRRSPAASRFTVGSAQPCGRRMAHIVIDARRIRYFGIGTYIRSLVHALTTIDPTNQYTLVSAPADVGTLSGLPENFHSAVYARDDHSALDHLAFPLFLRGLSPDLVHIPLARVPLLMIRPYVVTVHDLANLLFEEETSTFRMQLRRFRFGRGLRRATRVIAVSEATKRDVESQMGVPSSRITRVYNAPDPAFFARAPDPGTQEQQRILERYQIEYPFILYAGNIRRHKNVPRLVEAFAVVRGQLLAHHRESLHQARNVLVAADVARVQDERILDLVALQNALLLLRARVRRAREERRVGRVVHPRDAARGHPHLALHVPLRRLAHRNHSRRAPQSAAEPEAPQLHPEVRRLFLEEQIRQVVDSHHVGPDHEQRDTGQRDVHQVRREPAQKQRERQVIQRAMVVARVYRGMEVFRQPGERSYLGRPADQSVLVGAVDAAQRLHQTPDVGADSEIPYAAGIDDDVRHSTPARFRASNRRAGSGG